MCLRSTMNSGTERPSAVAPLLKSDHPKSDHLRHLKKKTFKEIKFHGLNKKDLTHGMKKYIG